MHACLQDPTYLDNKLNPSPDFTIFAGFTIIEFLKEEFDFGVSFRDKVCIQTNFISKIPVSRAGISFFSN
jgi:hypothetical protein